MRGAIYRFFVFVFFNVIVLCASWQIVEYAYKHKMATLDPEPHDKEAFVRSLVYSTDYEEFEVDSYIWPENAMTVQTCKLWDPKMRFIWQFSFKYDVLTRL